VRWPATPDDLAREQDRLASQPCEPWTPPDRPLRVAACAVVFGRAGLRSPRLRLLLALARHHLAGTRTRSNVASVRPCAG
jgi:hypothetical protein